MGFTDTVKKMLGKDKKGHKKMDKKNFYLESDSKRPSKDTYDMSGIEDIGEMPSRNPNSSRDEMNVPNRNNRENSGPFPRERSQDKNFKSNNRQSFSNNNNRNFKRSRDDLPQMPNSEPRKGSLPDLGRDSNENYDRPGRNVDRNNMDRIMDRLDDIENRLRSIERRVRRR